MFSNLQLETLKEMLLEITGKDHTDQLTDTALKIARFVLSKELDKNA